MKKSLYLIIAALVLFVSNKALANPGDTTWVQANIAQLNYYNDFDTVAAFPTASKTYRKIYMFFTLGKYQCPTGSQYCGSWDYTVQNYLMTPGGDTLEISRFITPYATTSLYFPLTWTYQYVFDVTDYVNQLKGNATTRIHYSGYSGGFTANVKFAFIEGTPDRNVVGLKRLWNGSFPYGNTTNPITNYVAPITATVPTGTVTTEMKMRITGHGEDAMNCNEFCPNTYDVVLNNNYVLTQNFWRDNCGSNPVSPQTGTWVYQRSGWCPGALVYTITNPLAVTSGSYNVNVTFPAYTSNPGGSNGTASYTIEAASVYYGAINKTLDASLEEILAPNNNNIYARYNNACGQPLVHVHNSGSTTITSLRIDYGVVGTYIANYTWNGNLAPLHDTLITLPSIWEMQAEAGLTAPQQFIATITKVNGQADQDATNNSITSTFAPSPLWSNQLVLKLKTSAFFNSNPSASAESWTIYDMNDNVVAQRVGGTAKTIYTDTVTLDYKCYKLVVETPDGGGLTAGNYFSGNSGDNGYFTITKYGVALTIAIPNYKGGDFGNGFVQYFSVSPFKAGITNITQDKMSLEAYPNPASANVNVSLNGLQQVKGTLQMIDGVGRVVMTLPCAESQQTLNVSNFTNGIYTLVYTDDATKNKVQTRLLIAK